MEKIYLSTMQSFIWKFQAFLLTFGSLLTLCAAVEEAPLDKYSVLPPRGYPRKEKHASDKVHGVIMGLTVVLIFPVGAMSWKLFDSIFGQRTLLWIHIVYQILGLALLVTGFGLGAWVAVLHDEVYNDLLGHVILGTIIVGLFLLQPLIGLWHHRLQKAGKGNRFLHQGHIWFGRVLIILGLVNGGTGLDLAANSPGGEKVYGSLAGVVGILYIGLLLSWHLTRARSNTKMGSPDAGESGEMDSVEGPRE